MSEIVEIDGRQITLVTAWMPLSWAYYDDMHLEPDVREAIDPHRGHYVSYLDSAFGWRALRCADCDTLLWDVNS
jgi:hypothetical protein